MATDKLLPTNSAARKRVPLCTGVLDYFSAALAAVAEVSFLGNEKHNPGQSLHWSREKSADHADCVARHLTERGGFDIIAWDDETGHHEYKVRHSAEMAWRALAVLQEELEAAGEAPPSRASRFPPSPSDLAGLSNVMRGVPLGVCDAAPYLHEKIGGLCFNWRPGNGG